MNSNRDPQPRAVIASGAGRYADPWHPFPETSPVIADILRSDGWQVEVIDDVDAALTVLDDVEVLVVNAGDPWRGEEPARGGDPAAARALEDAVRRGIGLVGLHCALSSLRDYPIWRTAIGGEWQAGRSWHPPLGEFVVRATGTGTGAEATLVSGDLTIVDERYTDLVVDSEVEVRAVHVLDGAPHPVIWTRALDADHGGSRAVASALGHDARAYGGDGYRATLARLTRWAARRAPSE